MKGRSLFKLASFALVFGVTAVAVQFRTEAATQYVVVKNENQLKSAFNNKTDDVVIDIQSDIEVKNPITVKNGSYTIITSLEAVTITYKDNAFRKHLSGATLFTFEDCDVTFAGDEEHQIILDGKADQTIWDSLFNLVNDPSYTCIDATDSNITLEYTTVSNFSGREYGAISVSSDEYNEENVTSSLVLGEGTSIVNNECKTTASIYANNSEVTLADGSSVSNNSNASSTGLCAGIYMDNAGVLQVNGGTISNNVVNNSKTTEVAGSAIYATGDAKVDINSGDITDNKCTSTDTEKSSAIVTENGENLTIVGGNISENKAGTTEDAAVVDLPVDTNGSIKSNARKGIENLDIKRQFSFNYKYNPTTEEYSYSYHSNSGAIKQDRVGIRIAGIVSNAYFCENDVITAKVYYKTHSSSTYYCLEAAVTEDDSIYANGKILSATVVVANTKFDLDIDAYVVVTVNGVDYTLKEKTFSCKSLAQDYVNNAAALQLNKDQIKAIEYIAK